MAHRPHIALACTRLASGACLNALCGVLWVALAALAVGLLVIRFRRDIEIPEFALRRIEARLAEFQVRPTFERSAFDPTGLLLVEGVKLSADGGSGPLLEIEAARVRFNPWYLLAGAFEPDELVLEGVRLNCPAELSPTGAGVAIAGPGRLTVRRDGDTWRLVGADFLVRGHRVHATAEITAGGAGGPAGFSPEKLLADYYRLCRATPQWFAQLARVEHGRLELDVRRAARGPAMVTARARAGRVEVAPGVVLHELALAAAPVVQPATGRVDGELAVACREATTDRGWTLHRFRTVVPFALREWTLPGSAGEWTLLADAVVGDEQDAVGALRARVAWDGVRRLRATVAGLARGGAIEVAADGDVVERRGEAAVQGVLPPRLVNEALARVAAWRRSRILAQVVAHSAARVAARATFGPGLAFERAEAEVALGRAHAYGVDLRAVSAEIAVDGRTLDVQRIVLRRDDAEVRGSYTMDLATQDYRFLLGGRLFPEAISPWFSEWWPRLWRDFDFRGTQPTTDVDVRGRWRFPHLSVVVGRMQAGPVTLRGVPMDAADVSFFIRPDHYDIVYFDARRPGQRATGTFTRHDDVLTHDPVRIDFDFVSNVPLAEGAVFFGPEGKATVAPYVFAQPPEVAARGRIEWRDGRAREDITARVSSPGEFRFEGFPVTNAALRFDLRDDEIHLHEIAADLAGGRLVGHAHVGGPSGARRLEFDGALRGADLAGTIKTWNEFRAATGGPAAATSASVAANLGTHGKLDLELKATGPLDNLMGLRGTGKAAVTGAELGEVQMLGFLSRLMQGTIFGFTSLRFTNADATFAVEETDLAFSKLTFTGPSSRLEARGRYAMPDEKLNFQVSLRPFRESDYALANLIGWVLEPLARVLEVKLTGTLAKPDWAFTAGPTNLLRNLERSGGAPAPVVPFPPPAGPIVPAPAPTPATPVPPAAPTPAPKS